jgi:uncharacterized protein involved in exopolysaccharide biosynthesis/Mrp family chromosome partitioning ATPase
VVFRHKKKFIVFFIITVTLVTVGAFKWPKTYESSAQVMIRLGRENAMLDPTAAGAALNIGGEARENEINSEMEVIKSRELAEKVLDVMGLDRILNRKPEKYAEKVFTQLDSLKLREQAVLAITKSLTTEVVKKTNVITIGFQSYDPKIAQEVINRLIGFYQEKHEAIYRPSGSLGFFEKQTDTLGSALSDKEDSLRSLKNMTGIASIEAQQTNLITRISALQLELEQVEADYAASKAKIETMQKTNENLPRIINTNAERDLQISLYTEQSNFSALSAKVQSVRSALYAARREQVNFNDNAVGLSRLQREHDINETNYRKYSDNLEQSRIDHDLKAGNFSNIAIVQPATFIIKPIKPKKRYVLVLGMFFGLFGGLCIAFLLEFMDHTFKNGEEIESYLRLPALGVVPLFNAKKGPVFQAQSFANEDVFESIRGVLHSTQPNLDPPWVIGVTSCYGGEGTSTIAINLAKSLASHNNPGKVLLVDLNVDAPSVHSMLGLPLSPGFTDMVLPAPAEVEAGVPMASPVSRNVVPGVDVVPAGHKSDKAARLGQSWRFSKIVTAGKKYYSYIVFDIPPISKSSMSIELAKHFNGIVLVVEAERARREVVKQSITKISRAGSTIFGVVLNKRRYYVPKWAYNRL